MRGRTFHLDRDNGKLFGVCAGIANYTGVDVTLVRVAVVVVTLAGAFPWTLVAYAVAAWVAGRPRHRSRFRDVEDAPAAPKRQSTYEIRETMTDIDRRMAEVETYVTTSNSSLAREIEELR